MDVPGFFEAIRTGNLAEVVRNLDAHPWLVDVVNPERGINERQPLHWASEHQPESVRVLLEHGADLNSCNLHPGDCYGRTPLTMNASQDDDCHEVTALLIEAGADIHATDGAGASTLDHAVAGGRTRIADVLRRSGA